MKNSVIAFLDFIDRRAIVRRSGYYLTWYLTIKTLFWSMEFASKYQPGSGADMALLIAAIWTPLTALQGYSWKSYNDSRAA